MMENRVAVEQVPTLMIMNPFTTVPRILLRRQDHDLHAHFEDRTSPGEMLVNRRHVGVARSAGNLPAE
jgi:hypothetical protein